jgi:hypothetical protein
VGEQDCRTGLCEQRGHGLRDHAGIIRASVGRDRAEELIQRLWLAIELDIVEVVGPLADPELVEEKLIKRCGLDRRRYRAIACSAATRLIDEMDREAAAQEDGLETFAAVRSGFQLRADW